VIDAARAAAGTPFAREFDERFVGALEHRLSRLPVRETRAFGARLAELCGRADTHELRALAWLAGYGDTDDSASTDSLAADLIALGREVFDFAGTPRTPGGTGIRTRSVAGCPGSRRGSPASWPTPHPLTRTGSGRSWPPRATRRVTGTPPDSVRGSARRWRPGSIR